MKFRKMAEKVPVTFMRDLWRMLRHGPSLYLSARVVGFTRWRALKLVVFPLSPREPAIDPMRCMALRDPDVFGGPRCQAVATHFSQVGGGRICARCAAFLRERLRDPNTLGNTLAGGRARTEEEICRLVVELPPEA